MDADTTDYGEPYNYDDTDVTEAEVGKTVGCAVRRHAVKAYKKIHCDTADELHITAIAELMIPKGALTKTVITPNYDRTDFPFDFDIEYKTDTYKIMKITTPDESAMDYKKCYSIYDPTFEYKVGGIYYAKLKNGLWFHRWKYDAVDY